METRASYVVVGAVVLALLAGLVAFSLWLVEAGVDRNLARYEIAFAGSVSGLPDGGRCCTAAFRSAASPTSESTRPTSRTCW
jgi:hypothetical protein